MSSLMYFGIDNRNVKLIEELFTIRREEFSEINSIMQITDIKRMEEVFIGISFDLLLFEQQFIQGNPKDWIENFRQKYKTKSPIIVVGENTDPLKVLTYIDAGFTDYFTTPPDKPLLVEKIILYCNNGVRSATARQVYSMQIGRSAGVGLPLNLDELSEFDCRMRGHEEIEINKTYLIYSDLFSDKENTIGYVIGRCYESRRADDNPDMYTSRFHFVGVSPVALTLIRNALRKTYISNKK